MFKFLARLLGAEAVPAAAAPKARLGVSVLESRECPAVLAAHLSGEPAHAAPPALHAAHAAPMMMAMPRPGHPSLNPQPLPP